MEHATERHRRIRRLKKIILCFLAAAILIPVAVSIILGIRLVRLSERVRELEEMLLTREETQDGSGVYSTSTVRESPRDRQSASGAVQGAKDLVKEGEQAPKQVYLTFDDGPSGNTSRILDILKENDVRATFFVVGKTDDDSVSLYRRIVEEGHTLAMHSYSHRYHEIYRSKDSFVTDMEKLQEYLYDITGVWPRFYRFPGGSSNTVSDVNMQELMAYLNENGITYFDWNISSGDASSVLLSAGNIVDNCLNGMRQKDECMILMHDANEKKTTVEALPEVIKKIRDRGDSVFLPVTDDTPPVQHIALQ